MKSEKSIKSLLELTALVSNRFSRSPSLVERISEIIFSQEIFSEETKMSLINSVMFTFSQRPVESY